jgi:hypothetical protein
MRTQIEADLLLQNIMLTADAMGLGAWIHASLAPPVLLRDPKFRATYGAMLGFDWSTPKWKLADIVRWQVPLPWYANLRATTTGLRHKGEYLIKAMCPPNYPTMADAVDAVVAEKFGPRGIYADESLFARIYRGEFGVQYLRQASNYSTDVIACARDICTYIYETHGRFPAHCDTLHVPGVWLQAHHVEEGYYQEFFRNGLTEEPAARPALAPGRLELLALGQPGHRQVPQSPGELALGDHEGALAHADLIDGVARGRPVGRRGGRGLGNQVLPATGVHAAGGVEHPAADVPILRYPGHLKPHPPSLSFFGYPRQ